MLKHILERNSPVEDDEALLKTEIPPRTYVAVVYRRAIKVVLRSNLARVTEKAASCAPKKEEEGPYVDNIDIRFG